MPDELRAPLRDGLEATPEQIRATQRILNAAGLAVPGWPAEWGGRDWTDLEKFIWLSELQSAFVIPPLAANVGMIGPVLAEFASPALKKRFLPATANLDVWWCQGFSEPDAGSDLAALRTSAVRDGDAWVVNGQKIWTTMGQHADWMFALVRTDPEAKKQQGISMLLIDLQTPGVTVRPIALIDGGHEVCETFFDNVRVPADQLVGEVNKGWDYAKFLLGNERVGLAAVASTKARLAQTKRRAAQIADLSGEHVDSALIDRFVALEAELMALEVTVLRESGDSEAGRANPVSSILKLRGSELEQQVMELTLDVAGPMSAVWDIGVDGMPIWAARSMPNYLNDLKATIYAGSSEVQRLIISSTILGLRA